VVHAKGGDNKDGKQGPEGPEGPERKGMPRAMGIGKGRRPVLYDG